MNKLKTILKKLGLHKVKAALKNIYQITKLRNKSTEEIFTTIYKKNSWNGQESVSGQGSDLLETEILLKKLPDFLSKYNVKTITDLPCGDYNWMQHLEYNFDHYTGIDIVEDIIISNNQKYGSDKIIFKQRDSLKDNIGAADLLLSRDLLIHFSQEDVKKFLKNIVRNNIKYLLTTHFIGEENKDIVTGQWCPINLMAAPYNLPKPLDYILEETKMFDGHYAKTKAMALWRMADIQSIIDQY